MNIANPCGELCWWLGFPLTVSCSLDGGHTGHHWSNMVYNDRHGDEIARCELKWTGKVVGP